MMSEDTARFYSDVIAAGGLINALQAALSARGSILHVTGLAEPSRFVVYARVEAGSRFSQVYIAAKERLFLFDFWCRGVVLAQGQTPDLAEAAAAINHWVGSSCTTAELVRAYSFVQVEPKAECFERGEEVEHRWREYLTHMGKSFPELVAFTEAASRHRELRQLFPFTSLNRFCFSRCTGYPFTGDTPYVWPQPNGEYQVLSPEGRVLGRGDAEAAVRLVIEHLPKDCGPAVPGTADDLAH